ncbi:hypothetical protein AB0F03_13730 [Streptomyces sp. NPDC028722]|uniref:hypothetical protein n=1 Tax=unclassified Streptomyces TaxID=2593676 RepID=UPI0033EE3E5F
MKRSQVVRRFTGAVAVFTAALAFSAGLLGAGRDAGTATSMVAHMSDDSWG